MMSIETILQALEHYTGYFPDAPLRAAIDQQEEITPHLLALVERATRDIDRIAADPAYIGISTLSTCWLSSESSVLTR